MRSEDCIHQSSPGTVSTAIAGPILLSETADLFQGQADACTSGKRFVFQMASLLHHVVWALAVPENVQVLVSVRLRYDLA